MSQFSKLLKFRHFRLKKKIKNYKEEKNAQFYYTKLKEFLDSVISGYVAKLICIDFTTAYVSKSDFSS